MSMDDGREPVTKHVRMLVPIAKADTPQRVSYGVVLEPDTEDLQGDVMSAEDIEKAAYNWMERSQTAGRMHSETVDGAKVVESYIAPADIPVETPDGPETIRKGSWVMGVRWPENIWKRIVAGEYTGYSVGGTGVRLEMEPVGKAGRGRMDGPLAAGPGGDCICPGCGHRESHPTGEPCTEIACPECGTAMVREDADDIAKGKWAPGPNAGWKRTGGADDDPPRGNRARGRTHKPKHKPTPNDPAGIFGPFRKPEPALTDSTGTYSVGDRVRLDEDRGVGEIIEINPGIGGGKRDLYVVAIEDREDGDLILEDAWVNEIKSVKKSAEELSPPLLTSYARDVFDEVIKDL
ncbi:MAG: hypothetical protein JW990_07975 [Thermoleophilia bacterium]|nr:hypothetical protein [Thermoleophilia bacterium]